MTEAAKKIDIERNPAGNSEQGDETLATLKDTLGKKNKENNPKELQIAKKKAKRQKVKDDKNKLEIARQEMRDSDVRQVKVKKKQLEVLGGLKNIVDDRLKEKRDKNKKILDGKKKAVEKMEALQKKINSRTKKNTEGRQEKKPLEEMVENFVRGKISETVDRNELVRLSEKDVKFIFRRINQKKNFLLEDIYGIKKNSGLSEAERKELIKGKYLEFAGVINEVTQKYLEVKLSQQKAEEEKNNEEIREEPEYQADEELKKNEEDENMIDSTDKDDEYAVDSKKEDIVVEKEIPKDEIIDLEDKDIVKDNENSREEIIDLKDEDIVEEDFSEGDLDEKRSEVLDAKRTYEARAKENKLFMDEIGGFLEITDLGEASIEEEELRKIWEQKKKELEVMEKGTEAVLGDKKEVKEEPVLQSSEMESGIALEEQKERIKIEKFNELAEKISEIPYEWTLDSAKRAYKKKLKNLQEEYDKLRNEITTLKTEIEHNTVDGKRLDAEHHRGKETYIPEAQGKAAAYMAEREKEILEKLFEEGKLAWKIIESELEKNGDLKDLKGDEKEKEAQKKMMLNAIRDDVLENPKEYGLDMGKGDVARIGEKLNLSKFFDSEKEKNKKEQDNDKKATLEKTEKEFEDKKKDKEDNKKNEDTEQGEAMEAFIKRTEEDFEDDDIKQGKRMEAFIERTEKEFKDKEEAKPDNLPVEEKKAEKLEEKKEENKKTGKKSKEDAKKKTESNGEDKSSKKETETKKVKDEKEINKKWMENVSELRKFVAGGVMANWENGKHLNIRELADAGEIPDGKYKIVYERAKLLLLALNKMLNKKEYKELIPKKKSIMQLSPWIIKVSQKLAEKGIGREDIVEKLKNIAGGAK